MVFLIVGMIFLVIGMIFCVFPSKKVNLIYGYRSYLSKQNQKNWQFGQKMCRRYFVLFGGSMTAIGLLLKWNGWTNYFLVEMILIPWFVVPIFGLIEENLKRFDDKQRGEDDEYIND